MIVMLSQFPYRSFNTSAGNVYVADQYGIIENVATQADQADLVSAGCATLNPNPTDLLGSLVGANFNVSTDQAFVNLNSSIRYRIKRVVVMNASISLTTAAGGLYTAASKGGTAIVAAGQAYSALTAANLALELTLAVPTQWWPAATPLFLSLTTAQGAPATADIYLYGDVYQ